MKILKQKLTSRKFLMAVAGVVSGVVLIASGNATEGAGTIIASVIGYLVAEGIIDAKAVQAVTDKVEDAVEEAEDTENSFSIGFTD